MAYYPPPIHYPGQGMSAKTVLIITAFIIAMIVGIFIYANVKAKKSLKEELPSDYADEMYNSEESKKIRYYASAVLEDIEGFSITHDVELYEELLREKDRIFEGVCVDYRRLAGESLRKSLKDEISFTNWPSYIRVRKQMFERMNLLQIA